MYRKDKNIYGHISNIVVVCSALKYVNKSDSFLFGGAALLLSATHLKRSKAYIGYSVYCMPIPTVKYIGFIYFRVRYYSCSIYLYGII